MNKEINITKEDFEKYCKFAYTRLNKPKSKGVNSTFKNIVIWLVFSVIFTVLFEVTDYSFDQFHWPTALMVIFVFLVFIVVYFININKAFKSSSPFEEGLVLGKRTIEINENGISSSNFYGTSFYKWVALKEIEENDGDVYLFFDTLLAQIFPKSSFSNELEVQSFKREVQALYQNAVQS